MDAGGCRSLDEATADRSFLLGDALSLADVALVAYTRVADEGGFVLRDYPNMVRWVARVEAALRIS